MTQHSQNETVTGAASPIPDPPCTVPSDAPSATDDLALGLYRGPALALDGELALIRIEGGRVAEAKFCDVRTGLGFVWRSYEGSFVILRRRGEKRGEAIDVESRDDQQSGPS